MSPTSPLLALSLLLWGTLQTITSMDMDPDELLGLHDVMDSLLDDPSWAQMHPLPCTETPWAGLECEVDQAHNPPLFHITKLHIGPDIQGPSCKPTAHLPKSLQKLPYLKTLSVFSCFTQYSVSLLPFLFEKMGYLNHLALQSNPSLITKIPSNLGKITSLRVLCLSQNNLQGQIPKEIGGLVNLEQLDLSFNNLSGQIPQELGGLQSLTILDLGHNNLRGPIPTSLGQAHLLEKMDLGFNKLKGTIPKELGHLERLVILDLSYNNLNGPIPSTITSYVQSLEYFILDHNPLNSKLPLTFRTLKKLKTLSFSSCGLIGTIPTNFSLNPSALFLDNNNLSGTIPLSLGSLPNLGDLNLSQNHLFGEIRFTEKFILRLGKRLDVRENKGLCLKVKGMKNMSMYLGIPKCLDSKKKRVCEKGEEMKHEGGLDGGEFSSRSDFLVQKLQLLFAVGSFISIMPFML